jgi:hypothetical protein
MIRRYVFVFFCWILVFPSCGKNEPTAVVAVSELTDDTARIAQAYQSRQSGFFVQGQGTVEKILKDDENIPRHQRFILRLSNNQTLLMTHNIDLAPRLEGLKAGDEVVFHGMYEWNDKGGIIHWTHHDPQGIRSGGWIIHQGKKYE